MGMLGDVGGGIGGVLIDPNPAPAPAPTPPVPPPARPPRAAPTDALRAAAAKMLAERNLRADLPATGPRTAAQAETEAAIKRLRVKGVPLTKVNIAEEIAMGGPAEAKPPVSGPGMLVPTARGGPSGESIEARIRARHQAEADAEFQRLSDEQRSYIRR